MPIIKKFKKGLYQYPNYFKVTEPDISVGDSDVKKIVPYRGVIQTQGDVISADEHNEIQKNGTPFVRVEFSTNYGVGVEAYIIKDFLNEQGLFNGLKMKFKVPTTNTNNTTVLVIDEKQYILKKPTETEYIGITAGDLKNNEIVEVVYSDGVFVLVNVINKASETEAGLVTLGQITEKIRTEAPSPNNASNTTYGLTKYGTTAGTALEGNRLAEILGVEYGGILQQVGQKELNKAYYDTVNRQLVMPIIENDLTYFESTKFSILSLKNTQEFVIYTDTLLEKDYHTSTLEVNIDVAEGTLRQYKYFNVFGGVSGFTKIPIDIILSRKNVKFIVSLDESTGYDASLALRFNQNRLTVIAYGKVDDQSHVKVMKIYRVTLTNM